MRRTSRPRRASPGGGALADLLQGRRLPVRPLAPEGVDPQIGGDAVQPGVETAAGAETADDAVQADEDLLSHVTRQLLVPDDVIRDPEDALPLEGDDRLERV